MPAPRQLAAHARSNDSVGHPLWTSQRLHLRGSGGRVYTGENIGGEDVCTGIPAPQQLAVHAGSNDSVRHPFGTSKGLHIGGRGGCR
jgi:hypothetical protein